MADLLDYLFGAASFMPHGYCLLWRPDLVALHALSDAAIALAYVAIPVAMLIYLGRRPDIHGTPRRIAHLFIAFILACALTHFAALATLWWPAYGAQGLIKALTAVISIATAVTTWIMLPRLLAIAPLQDLERANALLQRENRNLSKQVGKSREELNRTNDRFEMALTGSNISIFTQDADLRYTWIHNPRFGLDPSSIVGKTDAEAFSPEAAEDMVPMKRQVMESGEAASTYIAFDSQAAGTVYFDLVVHPTKSDEGTVDGVVCTAIDMTEKHLYEIRLTSLASRLAEANQRFEKALDGSLITVFEQDRDLTYVHVVNPPAGTTVEDFVGQTDETVFSKEDRLKLAPAKQRVMESGESTVLEVDLDMAGQQKNYNVSLDPARDRTGTITGVIGTAVDLTHKRENERQMHLVMRELTHRSKNLLAVIQAMARQTAARSDNPEDFVESFSARLQAMAASHDLLVSQSWYGADLRELVIAHLAQSIDPDSPQIEVSGPTRSISADAAQNLGLALHELTTNAAKYGALSVLDGKLAVAWEIGETVVRLSWTETGGPHVSAPKRDGFGRMLLERLVAPALDGDVTIDFAASGVRCTIEFPIRHLAG
ncbi:sensor histidine kinase [Stappia sp. ES.058]|uniref:sensor histidine kinase n=1 Tax=Stappia sp. ES.058 TaxID=1881061 RepID=UPI000879B6DA|nr:HWE histidine kinase domain-containing protein [Stappia sp. ES.058]SDU32477.1 Two-component sensor histidine kinase, contains HisKA and HATPase domains [Stappia sp. ES.058]